MSRISPGNLLKLSLLTSGVARAFPDGRVAHSEGQNEEENETSLRKNKKKMIEIWGKMRKVELLPTRDCEAGYGPVAYGVTTGCILPIGHSVLLP